MAPTRTKLDAGQASAALREAWQAVHGEAPNDETVSLLTAQWAHETGRGASMFNYNFGGIKGSGPSGLSVAQRTREGHGATERTIVDNFRAYTTAEEGATDYVRLLAKRFPEATEAARTGDPGAFVHALKTRGYFTGDEGAYTRSVATLAGLPLSEGTYAAPPVLDARPLLPPSGMVATGSALAYSDQSALLVDSLSLADEISRAALRIAASTKPNGERG